jgi:hypothetical protein
MAYAIMGGLAVATFLTLIFLPALYVTWFRIRKPEPQASAEDPKLVALDLVQPSSAETT